MRTKRPPASPCSTPNPDRGRWLVSRAPGRSERVERSLPAERPENERTGRLPLPDRTLRCPCRPPSRLATSRISHEAGEGLAVTTTHIDTREDPDPAPWFEMRVVLTGPGRPVERIGGDDGSAGRRGATKRSVCNEFAGEVPGVTDRSTPVDDRMPPSSRTTRPIQP